MPIGQRINFRIQSVDPETLGGLTKAGGPVQLCGAYGAAVPANTQARSREARSEVDLWAVSGKGGCLLAWFAAGEPN